MRIHNIKHLFGDAPPPRIPVGNEGFGSDSLLKICIHICVNDNPGGDCYWEWEHPNILIGCFFETSSLLGTAYPAMNTL